MKSVKFRITAILAVAFAIFLFAKSDLMIQMSADTNNDGITVAPDLEIPGNDLYSDGQVSFELENGGVTGETLYIPEGEHKLDNGETIFIDGDGNIYLGSVAVEDKEIGKVNDFDDGKLTIEYFTNTMMIRNGDFTEGDIGKCTFEREVKTQVNINPDSIDCGPDFNKGHSDGNIPGWTINEKSKDDNGNTVPQIWLGDLASKTQGREYTGVSGTDNSYTIHGQNYEFLTDQDYKNGKFKIHNVNDGDKVIGKEGKERTFRTSDSTRNFKTYEILKNPDSESSNQLRMNFRGVTHFGNPDRVHSTVFGLEVLSNEFTANSKDKLSFQWKAQGGNDDYEVYGFLKNNTVNTTEEVFYGKGNKSSGWRTEIHDFENNNKYQFRFVVGSYDLTDGGVFGAQLYISNIKVLDGRITSDLAAQIGQLVKYKNDEDNTDKRSNIAVTSMSGESDKVNTLLEDESPHKKDLKKQLEDEMNDLIDKVNNSNLSGDEKNNIIVELEVALDAQKATIDGSSIDDVDDIISNALAKNKAKEDLIDATDDAIVALETEGKDLGLSDDEIEALRDGIVAPLQGNLNAIEDADSGDVKDVKDLAINGIDAKEQLAKKTADAIEAIKGNKEIPENDKKDLIKNLIGAFEGYSKEIDDESDPSKLPNILGDASDEIGAKQALIDKTNNAISDIADNDNFTDDEKQDLIPNLFNALGNYLDGIDDSTDPDQLAQFISDSNDDIDAKQGLINKTNKVLDDIDNLPGLSNDDKDELKGNIVGPLSTNLGEIDSAVTPEDRDNVKDDAIDELENKQAIINRTNKALEEIDNDPNLSDDEKEILKGNVIAPLGDNLDAIDGASTPADRKGITDGAIGEIDAKQAVIDRTSKAIQGVKDNDELSDDEKASLIKALEDGLNDELDAIDSASGSSDPNAVEEAKDLALARVAAKDRYMEEYSNLDPKQRKFVTDKGIFAEGLKDIADEDDPAKLADDGETLVEAIQNLYRGALEQVKGSPLTDEEWENTRKNSDADGAHDAYKKDLTNVLYNKLSNKEKEEVDQFIKDHLTDGDDIITAITSYFRKNAVMTGEDPWNNFSDAQKEYINAFLSMHGYDDGFPALLAEAKVAPYTKLGAKLAQTGDNYINTILNMLIVLSAGAIGFMFFFRKRKQA